MEVAVGVGVMDSLGRANLNQVQLHLFFDTSEPYRDQEHCQRQQGACQQGGQAGGVVSLQSSTYAAQGRL